MQRTDWLSAAQAAALLGVRRATLYAYVSRGLVRARRSGTQSVYAQNDLELLRTRSQARKGHAAVAGGALLWGEPVLDTRVSSVNASGPHYRGQSALELARSGTAAELVGELLWTGTAPKSTRWPTPEANWLAALPAASAHATHPILAMCAVLAALPTWEATAPANELSRARRLVRLLAAIPAFEIGRERAVRAARAPTLAAALLSAYSRTKSSNAERAINTALVIIADHELNASTFAARVAAGAGADLPRCLAAALATLSGDRHGGAVERISAWLAPFAQPEQALSFIRNELAQRHAVPGFGHVLYPEGDPRAEPLLDYADALAPNAPHVRALRVAREAMALADAERATVDVGLVALTAALGWPPHAAGALFAVGRALGYVAHVMEQREQGHLLRPRARYVGG